MPINLSEIREFVSAVAQTDITELTLKSEDFELTVRKEISSAAKTVTHPLTTKEVTTSVVESVRPPMEVTLLIPEEAPVPPVAERKYVPITCPMVGTFYRASAPEEPAFVNVNDQIRVGQVLCIIEAMKLMNDIVSEINGQVMEIIVANGEPVEYGQTLMWINPE